MKTLNYQADRTHIAIRALDLLIASTCIVFLLPLVLVSLVVSILKNKPFIEHYHAVDYLNRSLRLVKVNFSAVPSIAYLFDVLNGTISICGIEISTADYVPKHQQIHTRVKAGIFSLSALHRLSGLASHNTGTLTAQTIAQYCVKHYVLISLKSVFNKCLYRCSDLDSPDQFYLFGVRIDNTSLPDAVDWVCTSNSKNTTKLGFFVNVNSLNICAAKPALKIAINAADRVFADGSGVRLGARSKGVALRDNVNGTDLLPELCQRARSLGLSLYLLGAEAGIAAQTAVKLAEQYPGLQIAGTHHGYFDKNGDDRMAIINDINMASADILLIGFGSPIQEQWLLDNRDSLETRTALAVGGLFDFYSGAISRSPLWMRELGLEWIWRLLQDPVGKCHRYVIGNPIYLYRLWLTNKA
jgi:exopolysaccharide biosynthesis WecB/TagA/CpsF family protein